MTRSLSSTILSLMEERYRFSMMLWVVLFSPSFTTPPGPIMAMPPPPPPPPPIIWDGSTGRAGWAEPGCSCLMGNLSPPPPIITGTVVRMLLLINVWNEGAEHVVSFKDGLSSGAGVDGVSRVRTGTCRAVLWIGAVRVVMPVGFCTVESTWVPSGCVVNTSESVFKI